MDYHAAKRARMIAIAAGVKEILDKTGQTHMTTKELFPHIKEMPEFFQAVCEERNTYHPDAAQLSLALKEAAVAKLIRSDSPWPGKRVTKWTMP